MVLLLPSGMVNGNDYVGDWLFVIHEYFVGKRFCLSITLRGTTWKVNFYSWSNKFYSGLSFCTQRNKLCLGGKIYWLARDYEIRLGDIAVRFLNDPGWGDYFLFRESRHQCFWILLPCGECMFWWLFSKVVYVPVPAGQSNCRVWHFLFLPLFLELRVIVFLFLM